MVRLRVALGVASSLVALAALSIVLAGTGEAQGNGNGQTPLNVNVVNTPLPVTGSLNAAVTGDVSATVTGQVTVNNPLNNPVLIRDVNTLGAKELWQKSRIAEVLPGDFFGLVEFDPPSKMLVIEHINILYSAPTEGDNTRLWIQNNVAFEPYNIQTDRQYFPHKILGRDLLIDEATTFYVIPGTKFQVWLSRTAATFFTTITVTATGHMIG